MLQIVIVDDEADFLKVFRFRMNNEFSPRGFTVFTETSARQCLVLLETLDFKMPILVISDIAMPDLDGFGLLATIQAKFPHVKSYVCTAYDTLTHRSNAKHVGAVQFFVKPLNFDEVFKAIAKDFPEFF